MTSKGIIAITGANGFLGKALFDKLTKNNWIVRGLVRNPTTPHFFKWNLPHDVDLRAFEGKVDALIHCSYETRGTDLKKSYKTNIEGTRRTFEEARKAGIEQIIFISSLAAHENALSFYGRSKYEIEKNICRSTDAIICPGTIIGSGGVFDRTRQLILKSPVIPVFYGREKKIQTIWVDDLTESIQKILINKLCGRFIAAEEGGVFILDFFKGIAAAENKHPLFLSLPSSLILSLTQWSEKFGLRLPITSENILGIKGLVHQVPSKEIYPSAGKFKSFEDSMACLGS